MRRKGEHRIGSLLDLYVKSNNLEQGLAEYRLIKAWNELLGKNISAATKSLYIRNEKLFVNLHSSVIRNELSMIKQDLIDRLNESAGKNVITDIIFR